jgi:BirA family biotin operon repressor/biotin-[acetyl-CoA-carboxylase] ligase
VVWAAATVLFATAPQPRGGLLAALVDAIERRVAAPAEEVLPEYVARCGTLGREVRARMIPMGPSGPQVVGRAVDVRSDGALVLLTEAGRRVRVPPQNLGILEDVDVTP